MKSAHCDKLIEAFGGMGLRLADPEVLTESLASGKPALIRGCLKGDV